VRFSIPGLTKALDAGLVKTVGRLLRAGQFHRVAKRVTGKDYAAEAHVIVRSATTDPALADPGRKRRAAVTVAHFLLVPEIVAATDLIATLPERVAERFAERYPLVVHRSPVRPVGFTLTMTWHSRTDADPARAWLRGLLAEVDAEC
jgi:DNA-binding transcriptional LysR family regulator